MMAVASFKMADSWVILCTPAANQYLQRTLQSIQDVRRLLAMNVRM